jgi:hypothetical protein
MIESLNVSNAGAILMHGYAAGQARKARPPRNENRGGNQ